jgi:hypothetical protein
MSIFIVILCLSSVFSSIHAFGGGFHRLEFEELAEQPELPQSDPDDTTDIRFLYQCIDEHNEIRRKHDINNQIHFNRELTDLSSRRAFKLAATGKFSNSKLLPELGILENAALLSTNDQLIDCRKVVQAWFDSSPSELKKEVHSYENTKIKISSHTDKVWKTSKQIGCSRMTLPKKEGVAVVCLYRETKK